MSSTPGHLPCKYAESCELPGTFDMSGEAFCILHWPNHLKDSKEFDASIIKQLKAGRSDFRHVHFPRGSRADFRGCQFSALADFREAVIDDVLILSGVNLPQGLKLKTENLDGIDLMRATVAGPVDIAVDYLHGSIDARMATFQGDILIHVTESAGGGVRRKLGDDAAEVGINFGRCRELPKRITLRGRFKDPCSFDGTRIHGVIDLQACAFDKLTFTSVEFSQKTELDLRDSSINGDLIVHGSPVPPSLICLNGCKIQGGTDIKAEPGKEPTAIIAQTEKPLFNGGARFTNVRLENCLLVGNDITKIKFLNVLWAKRYFRDVLYDEIALRNKADIPARDIREAYQILKASYQEKGNHALAGDFYYGEMEMKRREYGRLTRYISPEAIYWLLNGYGIGYIRAFIILTALLLGGAGLYLCYSPDSFPDFLGALRFSMQVTTFQRPPVPENFTQAGQWVQSLQAIFGPIQIALLGWALRMRLKR